MKYYLLSAASALSLSMVFSSQAYAGCQQNDLAGTWYSYSMSVDSSGISYAPLTYRCKVKLNSSGNVVASKSSCTVRGWEGKGNVNVTGGKIKVSSSCGVSGSISQGALGTVKIESGTLAKDKYTFSAVAYDAEFPAYITHLNAVKK